MSKLGGISLITLGSIGIGVALLRGTKHDPLMKIGVVKPKQKTKEETQFECDLLFQKITNDYFSIPNFNKQINDIQKQDYNVQGVKILTSDEKERISKLTQQRLEAEKNLSSNIKLYNESICSKFMPLNGCVLNGIPSSPDYNPECINTIDNEFDCLSVKDDIENLNKQIEILQKNPRIKVINSYERANYNNLLKELENKKTLLTKNNCENKSNLRKGVSYKAVRDCVQLDILQRELVSEIAFREKKKLELGDAWSNSSEITLKRLKNEYTNAQNQFVLKGCSARLESQKLKDNALVLTEQAIKSEDSVLKKNFKEQYVYIGLGAVLLLSGFYIVLKK